MFDEDDKLLELADELLDFFDIEEIFSMNDLTERDVISKLISLGLVMTYDDMRNYDGKS